jgi:antitoxin MazE
VKANIVTIGNSQGIRIPKALLEESGLSNEIELELCVEGILIRRAKKARENWSESFKQMAENNDDESFDDVPTTNYTKERWRW